MNLQELIYVIILPVLFFYAITYYLLKKSKIFGNLSNYYYSIVSALISMTLAVSLYVLNFSTYLSFLLSFFFVGLFLFFYIRLTILKAEEISKKRGFSSSIDKIKKDVEDLMRKYESSKEEERKEISKEIRKKLEEAIKTSKEEKRNIEREDWYIKAKKMVE